MGSGNGTWAKLYHGVWRHEKTMRLARSLMTLGVPERWSVCEAVGQLHRLGCGLAEAGDTGRLGHLTPREFATLTGWDDGRKAVALLAAWNDSGYIDHAGTPDAALHEFRQTFGRLIAKREKTRLWRDCGDSVGPQREPQRVHRGATKSPQNVPKSESESESISPSGENPLPPAAAVREPPAAAAIADAWGRHCPTLPQPARPLAVGTRKRLLAAAKREPGRDWDALFARVGASPFLTGQNPRGWRADVGWCIGPENSSKIDCGAYDPAPVAAIPQTPAQQRWDHSRDGAIRLLGLEPDAADAPAIAAGSA